MKFPIAILDVDDYLKKLRSILQSEDCIIFLDTNFFALYYSLYTSARNELSEWIKPLVEKGRIKIPVWVLHEYTNRFIRDKTHDYFNPIKRLNSLQKEFIEIKSFLRKNMDTADAAFISDLDLVENKLKEIHNLAKQKNGNLETIHVELESLLEGCVLKTDIESLVHKAHLHGNGRYTHRIPPGFEDSEKEQNGFGDLIIWYEVVTYCTENGIQKAVFLSNDVKKDWMYAPSKIKGENGKAVPNREAFKIIDPRLVHEFWSGTQSDDVYLINFELLTGLLLSDGNRSFNNLAKALQLSTIERDESKNEHQDYSDDGSSVDELLLEIDVDDIGIYPPIGDDLPDWLETVGVMPFEKHDFDFMLLDDELSEIVQKLRSYDWYAHNDAIERLVHLDLNGLKENYDIRSKLYHLGIAIYQSACSGAFKSRDYIESLEYTLDKYKEFVSVFLFTGMLQEIYFDSRGNFRRYELKYSYAREIIRFQGNQNVAKAFSFIQRELAPYRDYLLDIPSPEKMREPIQVEIRFRVDNWSNGRAFIISDISSDKKKLVHLIQNHGYFRHDVEGNSEDVEERIADFFAVLLEHIQFSYHPYYPEDPNSYFVLDPILSLGITPRLETSVF